MKCIYDKINTNGCSQIVTSDEIAAGAAGGAGGEKHRCGFMLSRFCVCLDSRESGVSLSGGRRDRPPRKFWGSHFFKYIPSGLSCSLKGAIKTSRKAGAHGALAFCVRWDETLSCDPLVSTSLCLPRRARGRRAGGCSACRCGAVTCRPSECCLPPFERFPCLDIPYSAAQQRGERGG